MSKSVEELTQNGKVTTKSQVAESLAEKGAVKRGDRGRGGTEKGYAKV